MIDNLILQHDAKPNMRDNAEDILTVLEIMGPTLTGKRLLSFLCREVARIDNSTFDSRERDVIWADYGLVPFLSNLIDD